MNPGVIRPVFLCGSPERGLQTRVYGLAVTYLSRPNFVVYVDAEDIASPETECAAQGTLERYYTLVAARPIILQYAQWLTELAAMTSL